MRPPARAGSAAAGAALALAVEQLLSARPPGGQARWQRSNHRGAVVSLLSGPALVVAVSATAAAPQPAAALAGFGAAAVGAYDDVAGARDEQHRDKGLRGHAAALREGRVSAGVVKTVGIGAVGLVSARLSGRRRPVDLALDGALVAVCANLLNLFDLRPGRALKVGALASAVLGQPGPVGAALALLPGDLRERTMLGDAGANGVGAVLGLSLARRLPARRARLVALSGGVGLTLASEVVSFTRVIDAVPPLRAVDRLGRLP